MAEWVAYPDMWQSKAAAGTAAWAAKGGQEATTGVWARGGWDATGMSRVG